MDVIKKELLLIAQKSTCIRHSVGCIFIDKQKNILAKGYNGVENGVSCKEYFSFNSLEEHRTWSLNNEIHAEISALKNFKNYYTDFSLIDKILVTHKPCKYCLLKLNEEFEKRSIKIPNIYYIQEWFNDDLDKVIQQLFSLIKI
jgi:deoxycytidylate deaminase